MRLTTFASGSSGNCSLLCAGEGGILIDAGISFKRIQAALCGCGMEDKKLSGVLITHEHSDHIGGLPTLMKRLRLPVFAPGSVCRALRDKFAAPADLLVPVLPGAEFSLGGVLVRAFKTPHDTPESVGYRFESAEGALGYCTDLGHVTSEVLENLNGVSAAVIECNHDTDMLKYGPYPPHLKRRIQSDFGHLSNRLSAALALSLAQNGAKQLVLAHLSAENNTPRLAENTVSAALEREGVAVGRDLKLYIAPKDGLLSICLD